MQQGNVAVDSARANAKGSAMSLVELGLDGRPAQLHQPGGGVVASVVGDRPNAPLYARRPTGVRVRILPVSRVKVTPAPVRETTLARERLLDWLDDHIDRRLVSIVAETGYGKTTLLADFCRRTAARCLWYKLDAADIDPPAFISYVVAAAREFIPDFGEDTVSALEGTLESGQPWDMALAALIDDLASFEGRRTALILDDYHLVDEAPEIRSILTALLRSAPADFGLVLLTRRRPRLPLGRLVAQGEVAEMTTADLRFTIEETARLFRDTYGQPLDPEMIEEVEARTEGWAASLQLLRSTIRGRSPAEVRAVVRAMSGAEGPVYDYLAQEVVGGLSPELQRFVTLTSILENVTVDLAVAIFAADQNPPRRSTLEYWAREADEVGLLTRHSTVDTSQRYHPLLRDLLLRRLRQKLPETALRAMHLRVARTAEPTDWLVACHHYIEAGERSEASRVLAANADRTLGSGQWGDAAALVRALEVSDEDPRIAVIMARDDVYSGRVEQALARLDRFDLATLDGADRGLVAQGRIHALWWGGRLSDLQDLVSPLLQDPAVNEEVRQIARGVLATVRTATDGPLADATQVLRELAENQANAGQPFFSAISYNNLLFVELARGEYQAAARAGNLALEQFARVAPLPDEVYSSHFGLARAYAELGDMDRSRDHLDIALSSESLCGVEQWFYGASLLAVIGETDRARRLLERGRVHPGFSRDAHLVPDAIAQVRLTMAEGCYVEACDLLALEPEELPVSDVVTWLTWTHLRCITSVAAGRDREAAAHLVRAIELARRQGSAHFMQRLRLLSALTSSTEDAMHTEVALASNIALLEVAELIVSRLDRLEPVPTSLVESIQHYPSRWLPLLRAAAATGTSTVALGAARLLDRFGDMRDVALLRSLAKKRTKGVRTSELGTRLIRSTSPRLEIRDLGRTTLQVGERTIELASVRRKAAAVLVYILSRPGLLAVRDQLLDALWPDIDPDAALNSLNQTLYFLRRDIDPVFDDDLSPHYVRFEGELVWLDRELVTAQSSSFSDAASQVLAERPLDANRAIEVFGEYTGRFAPEFEYDDWAIGRRNTLHAVYLHLAGVVTGQLAAAGDLPQAADVTRQVLMIDAAAEGFERSLIWLYGKLGARSAAAEQYGHYAASQREEYGVEPPSLGEIMAGPLGNPAY